MQQTSKQQTSKQKLLAPDFGSESAIIAEIIVSIGDHIEVEDPILVLESDKASVDLPSSLAGVITKLLVKEGDMIRPDQAIAEIALSTEDSSTPIILAQTESIAQSNDKDHSDINHSKKTITSSKTPKESSKALGNGMDIFDVIVLGAGPGGYTAAFRAADLGLKVALVNQYDVLGGVCLNVGCIPSKALLHTAQIINESQQLKEQGVDFGQPKIEIQSLSKHKQGIIDELTGGLSKLASLRKVHYIHGEAQLVDSNTVEILNSAGKKQSVQFKNAIIATGSRVIKPSFIPTHANIWDSTDALELRKIPKHLIVLGGGIIGLEMATVYQALGSDISIIELGNQLIPEADKDMVLPLQKRLKTIAKGIYTKTKATAVEIIDNQVEVKLEGAKAPDSLVGDALLVAVGRAPNGHQVNAEALGIEVDEKGFIPVNDQQQTSVPNVYAIGDVVGQPMLAHKATHQAKVAAETIAGEKVSFNPMSIPSVAYTHPEVAWIGKTEKQLKTEQFDYYKGQFPWQASGRALSSGARDGMSKALFCSQTHRLIGAAITGPCAGDIICEAILALEMGATDLDISLTVHPHPTLGETLALAAEHAHGSITDILPSKKH